jgi:hypothetical protein
MIPGQPHRSAPLAQSGEAKVVRSVAAFLVGLWAIGLRREEALGIAGSDEPRGEGYENLEKLRPQGSVWLGYGQILEFA